MMRKPNPHGSTCVLDTYARDSDLLRAMFRLCSRPPKPYIAAEAARSEAARHTLVTL